MLDAADDLDAELMGLHCVEQAAREAHWGGLAPRAADRYFAHADIAARHGCASWDDLAQVAEDRGLPRGWIEAAADRLAIPSG